MPYPVAYALSASDSASSSTATAPSFDSTQQKSDVQNAIGAAAGSVSSGAAGAAAASGQKAAASSPSKTPADINDLVVLVTDISLYTDPGAYAGLKNTYPTLSSSSFSDRIERYAKDIVQNNEKTDTKILFFDRTKDTPATLRDALENLYVNGEGIKNNRLAGVVFIGNIPMPVVNKKGNRFATVFPYTDFTDPVYTYDATTDTFVKNDSIENPKAEVWHGVIALPSDNAHGSETLAEYFDKNHLYYTGEKDFSDFDKKMFFSDLIREKERLSKDTYPYYLRYLDSLEDLAYYRFNKYWANELTQKSMSGGSSEGSTQEENKSLGQQAKDSGLLTPNLGEIVMGVKDGSGGNKTKEALNMMPDIQTKNVVDTATKKYFQLLPKYISQLNDYVQFTGRYFSGDADHTPGLISIKDQYTQEYLRNVNDALEKRVNDVAKAMEQKMPVLKFSKLSGSFGNEIEATMDVKDSDPPATQNVSFKDFVIALRQADINSEYVNTAPITTSATPLAIRYPYYNEVTGKYLLNGISLDVLNSPKQCYPLLGSTKDEYFDNDTHVYDPKAEGVTNGKYSILTRSTKLDDAMSSTPSHTIGVNTRLVDPDIACLKSGGIGYDGAKETCKANVATSFTAGAIIEDNATYGISAFSENYLSGFTLKYKNPFDDPINILGKGDLIVQVNSYNIGPSMSVDQAVEKVYKSAEIAVKCTSYNLETNECTENPNDAIEKRDIKITYFKDGQKMAVIKSFEIQKKKLDGTDTIWLDKGNSHGAIFDLLTDTYPNKQIGMGYGGEAGQDYGGSGFDNAAGCLFMVNQSQTDKCFYRLANTPILDPAGSVDLKNIGGKLKFPSSFDGQSDASSHFDVFQYPDNYKLSEIDDVYMNACFDGLPSVVTDDTKFGQIVDDATIPLNGDSNRFANPFDQDSVPGSLPAPANLTSGLDNEVDLYGRYIDAIGRFLFSKTLACSDGQQTCSQDKLIVMYGANTMLGVNQKDQSIEETPPFIGDTFKAIKEADANDIILNSQRTVGNKTLPKVTLKMFADHYGLFDGINNDNLGQADDYCLTGTFCEAATKYSIYRQYNIDPSNLSAVYRRFLSHPSPTGGYTIHEDLLKKLYPSGGFENTGGITLKVELEPYKDAAGNPKYISSLILHNEPTAYTLWQQTKAMGTLSLPIDNPRYVAFQDVKGNMSKIEYPNLFEIKDESDLNTKLAKLASEIAHLPGSYKLIGLNSEPTSSQYPYEQIKNEVLNNYLLPTIQGASDTPSDGFNLIKAGKDKVYDAIKWLNMGIDEKYQYVLTDYLNPEKDAYADDSKLGYESAYLVIGGSGQSDFFQLSFNKDLPEETDPSFNPLSSSAPTPEEQAAADKEEAAQQDGGSDSGSAPDGPEIWVWLTEELYPFMDDVQSIGQFENACVLSEDETNDNSDDGGSGGGNETPAPGDKNGDGIDESRVLSQMKITTDKSEFDLNGNVTVTVEAIDQNGNSMGKDAKDKGVYLEIKQDKANKVFSETGLEFKNFLDGFATFKLKSLGVATNGTDVSAVCPKGICDIQKKSSVMLNSAANTMSVTTYTIDQFSDQEITITEPPVPEPPINTENIISTTGPGEAIPPGVPSPNEPPATPPKEETKIAKDPIFNAEPVNDLVELTWKNPYINNGFVIGQKVYMGPGDCKDFAQIAYLDPSAEKYSTENLQPAEYCFKLTQKDKNGGETKGTMDKATVTAKQGNADLPPQDVFVPAEPPAAEPASAGGNVSGGTPSVKKELSKEDVGKIKVLVSDPVNKITVYSTVIQNEVTNKLEEVTFDTWEDFYTQTSYHQKYLEEPPKVKTWEDHFVEVNYYKKYLEEPAAAPSTPAEPQNGEPQAKIRTLLAAVSIDVGNSGSTNSSTGSTPKTPSSPQKNPNAPMPDNKNPFVDSDINPNSKFLTNVGDEVTADGKSLMQISTQIFDSTGNIDIGTNHKVQFRMEPANATTSASATKSAGAKKPLPEEEVPSFVKTPGVDVSGGTADLSTKTGEAQIYIKSGTKTGTYKISAYLDNSGSPLLEKEIYLVAGAPYFVEIKSPSYALIANGESKTTLTLTVKDKYGNICDNSYDQLALFSKNDKAYLDPKADKMPELPGTQIKPVLGQATVDLISTTNPGDVKVIAVLMDYNLEELFRQLKDNYSQIDFSKEIGTSKMFRVLENAELSATLVYPNADNPSIKADNNSIVKVKTELLTKVNGKYNRITAYNGPLNFTIVNDQLLADAKTGKNTIHKFMAEGTLHEANIKLKSKTVAGDAEVQISAPGFASKTIKIPVLAGSAARLELSSSEDYLFTNGENISTIQAKVSDKYGNAVEQDNTTSVVFTATDATKNFIQFLDLKTVVVQDGIARIRIKGLDKTGVVNLTAKVNLPSPPPGKIAAIGPKKGTLSLGLVSRITKDEIKDFAPKALYVSLLGGSFGNFVDSNNVAKTLLYSGKTQAISSITASPIDSKRLFFLNPNGKTEPIVDSLIPKLFASTKESPFPKMIVSDSSIGAELATIFLVPKTGTPLNYIDSVPKAEDTSEAVTVENITPAAIAPADHAKLFEKEGIYLERLPDAIPSVEFKPTNISINASDSENGSNLFSFDKYGRIFIKDEKRIAIRVISKDDPEEIQTNYLSFVVSIDGTDSALIVFNQNFNKDVNILPYKSLVSVFNPGVYIKYSSSIKKYGIIPALSGSSTFAPQGAYIVDIESSLDKPQAPGFADTSLEDANTSEGVGFHGDNKHMLLFASGNSVGESNLPYGSEVGIVYGDPTIRLKIYKEDVSDITHFTKDLGKAIFTSSKDIDSMIKFDYDGDGMDDVLLVYNDGMMRLLKTSKGKTGFTDMGYILNIYGGILSIAKLDVNNDGFDDLVVGNKEPCIAGEECINLYTNNKGNFVRTSLDLKITGKLLEMKAADMNTDGCDDLVVSDTSGNVRIFYNNFVGGQCKGLEQDYGYNKNFGFTISPTQNSESELFIYYPGVQKFDTLKYSNASKFIQFTIEDKTPPAAPPLVDDKGKPISDPNHNAAAYAEAGKEFRAAAVNNKQAASKVIPPESYPKTYYFLHILEDPAFKASSSKYGVDVNGGVVEQGDQIEYTITLKNNTSSDIRKMMVSSPIPSSLTLIDDKPRCADAGCTDDLKWIDTGVALRPKLITGITVPAGGKRTIKYTMQINVMPVVHFELGRDLAKYPSNVGDPYLDIRVRPKSTKSGVITHLYSTGLDASSHIIYKVFEQDTRATLGDDKTKMIQDLFSKFKFPDPAGLIDAASKMKKDVGLQTDENGAPKIDSSGNPLMDLLSNPPSPFDKDNGKKTGNDYANDVLGGKKNRETMEQQVSQVSYIMNNMVADRDFDGIPDSLDYSIFNPLFTGPIEPVREALISACNANRASSAYAGSIDTNGSDGSISASASYAPFSDEGAAIADKLENLMNQLRCKGAGCLPIPYNVAFLAPEIMNSIYTGLPILSIGGKLPPVFPMLPSPNPYEFRLYLIPTTTLGLVVAPCVLPGYGLCWPIALPIASQTGCDKLVDAFLGMVMAVIDTVMADVESATGGAISGGSGDQGPPEDIPGSSQYNFPADSPVQGGVSYNIRIPGFPSVITDWIDKQTDEIYNKLLDFPDIYAIYPDVVKVTRNSAGKAIISPGTYVTSNYEPIKQVVDKFRDIGSQKDAATTIGSLIQTPNDLLHILDAMPLIQIETKPITIKIPMISSGDAKRLITEFATWKKYHKQMLDAWVVWVKEFYSCGETGGDTICDRIILDTTKLMNSIEKFMGDLEEFLKLPRKIMEYRMALAKYAEQIICYLDAIMKFAGVYLMKQIKIINKWVQMVVDVIKMILDWKLILDIIVDFKTGCDECKNHRFSMLGLLLQLMVVIPTPPIIPLPKWPDLVFDFSQVSTGIKIVWPEIKFVPEIIYLPKLPYLWLPTLAPDIKFELPGFFVNFPKFEFPELPDLPPLPMPKLPDLPLPPKIPPLPDLIFQLAFSIKIILKIICLIMKALIPIPEWALKTEAETLTQPNVQVVLMIIAKLAISFPPITYDFVREVRATLQMSFSAEMDPIYTAVKSMTDVWNLNVRKLVLLVNQASQSFSVQQLIDKWMTEFYNAIMNSLLAALGMCANTSDPGAPDADASFTLCVEAAATQSAKDCAVKANQGAVGEAYCNSAVGAKSADFVRGKLTAKNKNALQPLIDKFVEMAKTKQLQPSVLPSNYQYQGQDYLNVPGGGDFLDKPEIQELKKTLSYYGPYKEFNQNVESFDKLVNDYIAQMEVQNVPETYYLAATQDYLKPSDPILNQNIANLSPDVNEQQIADLNLPEFERVKQLKEGLIAYTENLKNSGSEITPSFDDINSMNKFIADNNESVNKLSQIIAKNNVDLSSEPTQIASLTTPTESDKKYIVKGSFFGTDVENKVKEIASSSGITGTSSLIAASDVGMDQSKAYSDSTAASSLTSVPVGFFVTGIDPNTNKPVSESVLRYTEELSGKTSALFMDFDKDTDTDIVYSLGGDVYVKENHKIDKPIQRGEFLPVQIRNTVGDYLTAGGSRVNGVTSPYENTGQADISWLSKGDDVPAYEVILRKSLEDKMDKFAYRFVAVPKGGINPLEGQNAVKTELSSVASPSISVKLTNGNYYATVFALDKKGQQSVASESTIVAPQPCADKEPPFPIASATELNVAIFKTAEVNAVNSFDTAGEITQYYLETLAYPSDTQGVKTSAVQTDIGGAEPRPKTTEKPITKLPKYIWSDLDLTTDSDSDGLAVNDKDNPFFRIGPFMNSGDIGKHEFLLHVADQSGNQATQNITVNVFVPDITLDQTISASGVANGKTNAAVSEMPFALMKQSYLYRVMEGQLKLIPYFSKILTASAHKDKKYYTVKDGSYEVKDLNLLDMILVRNSKDEIVAEINPKSANSGIVKQGYEINVNGALPPQKPTHLDIDSVGGGTTLAEIFVVANPNIGVKTYDNFKFTADSVRNIVGGVHVSDITADDEFVLIKIPMDSPSYPGGAAVINKTQSKQAAVIDTSGNIVIIDPKITIQKKKNNHVVDPLIFELLYDGRLIMEIYISALRGNQNSIIIGPGDVPFQSPQNPAIESLYGNDTTGIDFKKQIQQMIKDFFKQGVINGIRKNGIFDFGITQMIKRSEFVKVVLDMLCIIPRKPAAYLPYSKDEAGGGFSDIKYDEKNLSWFYPYVKEAALLGLVQGYLGETDSNGLHPFRPEETITRAEAVKIILEALQLKGIIDISSINVDTTVPGWYWQYMEAGKDLTPFLKKPLTNNFIITSEEGDKPEELMTYEQLFTMANRVLDIYNCFEEDKNKNGMSDFCEAKYGVTDPNADQDNDGLANSQECALGTDPTNKDADGGGVLDGDEYNYGSDMLDPVDDPIDTDGDGLTNIAETLIYHTDPNDPDTDKGGVKDGVEVLQNLTDPLNKEDDSTKNKPSEGEEGVYIVPSECNACPCPSTLLHKADAVNGDIFFSVISNYDETQIFSKSEEVTINSLKTQNYDNLINATK